MPRFGWMDVTGQITNCRTISIEVVRRCPHLILDPDHYREDRDLTCRCDDPEAIEMIEWGYVWLGGRWRTP